MNEIRVNFPKNFKKMFFKLGLNSDDLDDLEKQIVDFERQRERKDELLGDLIPGTGGAIKYRFVSKKSKSGKSGAERVIYCAFDISKGIREYNFLLCYAKNKKETLTDREKKALKNAVKQLKNRNKNDDY